MEIEIEQLIISEHHGIYSENSLDFEILKDAIRSDGAILTPISVTKNHIVISGARRLQAARELGIITKVPIKYDDIDEDDIPYYIVNYNIQREKKPSEKFRECKLLEEKYGLGQGTRSDIKPIVQKAYELRSRLLSNTERKQLKAVSEKIIQLYPNDPIKQQEAWTKLDNAPSKVKEIMRINSSLHQKKISLNASIEFKYDQKESIKITHGDCTRVSELEDNSVGLIITSPPYYHMRDYEIGEGQIGKETTVDEYVANLVYRFELCKPKLEQTASVFVNLGDCIEGSQYSLAPHIFVTEMKRNGWKVKDIFVWSKAAPHYYEERASLSAHEYLFHFSLNDEIICNKDWLNDAERYSLSTIGKGERTRLKSYLNFEERAIQTCGWRNERLRKACDNYKIPMTHSASFPPEIPELAIQLATHPGQLVVDLFHGTGTTGAVCERLNRRYHGFELNGAFIEISKINLQINRQQQDSSKKKVFGKIISIENMQDNIGLNKAA